MTTTTTQESTMTTTHAVTITRRSARDGRPFTRTVYLVRPFPYAGTMTGEGWIVTNTPGGPERPEVLTPMELATRRTA